jgi:hypothetical protein
MNIEDFKPQRYCFEEVFEKQKELKLLYEPDAKEVYANFDIDSYEDQEYFKKVCWRITEELMEALEDSGNPNHFKEELIDGFNFTMELYLMYGWGFEKLPKFVQTTTLPINDKVLMVIYQLGITANVLKNRQWRRSQYLVDLLIFESRFKEIWSAYLDIFYHLGMSNEDILDLWSLKYQVNLFRINSNY